MCLRVRFFPSLKASADVTFSSQLHNDEKTHKNTHTSRRFILQSMLGGALARHFVVVGCQKLLRYLEVDISNTGLEDLLAFKAIRWRLQRSVKSCVPPDGCCSVGITYAIKRGLLGHVVKQRLVHEIRAFIDTEKVAKGLLVRVVSMVHLGLEKFPLNCLQSEEISFRSLT